MEQEAKPAQFGAVLKKIRTHKGLSQEALSDLCFMDRSYIGQLERGDKSPTLNTMLKICAALKISLSDLAAMIEQGTR